MKTGAILLAVGLLFCWLAVSGWRSQGEEKISLIEAAILKTTGAEPLPLTRFDKLFDILQLIMLTIFGPIMSLLGLVLLIA